MVARLKHLVKALTRAVAGEYGWYHIFMVQPSAGAQPELPGVRFGPCTVADITGTMDPVLREQAFYSGSRSRAFGAWRQGDLVAVCWVWDAGEPRIGDVWAVHAGEAYLAQVFVSERERGSGLATALYRFLLSESWRLGVRRLYSRVWHNHTPSLKLHRKTGWQRIATAIDLYPSVGPRRVRLVVHARRSTVAARASGGDGS